MLKIRLCHDTEEQLQKAVDYFAKEFPTMRFSKPRKGTNPKYEHAPKWFSYGEPRVKNGKPRRVVFSTRK